MNMGIVGQSGVGGPHVVSGASGYAPPATKMSNLFEQMDTNGSGAVNQSQFNQAFQTQNPPGVFRAAGADAIFSQLDPNGTGTVSKTDFVNTMTGLMRSLRGGPSSGTAGSSTTSLSASPADTLASSLRSLNQLGGSVDPLSAYGFGNSVNLLA